MIAGIAAFAAWLGASAIVLADGRYGLAAGMVLLSVALAVITWQSASLADAAAVLGGGIVAAALRFRSGPPGWAIMPPGSTPRLVLCLAGAVLALWIAATAMQGSGVGLRFTVMAAIGLPAARILATEEVAVATTAAGALLLGTAVASGIPGAGAGIAPYLAAALIAVGAAWWPRRAASAG